MRKYLTKSSTTLKDIAIIHDGSASNLSNYKKSNPSIKDINKIAQGVLVNVPDGAVTPPKQPLVGGEKDEIIIDFAGDILEYWTELNLVLSADKFDTFAIKRAWDYKNEKEQKKFKPFQYQNVIVKIGGEKITTCQTVNLTPSQENYLDISGYSLPAILADCTAASFPLTWTNIKIGAIIDQLIKPFGLKKEITGDEGNPFKQLALEPPRKLYDFIVELAKQRGLLITNNIDGDLVLHKAGNGDYHADLISGQYPIINERVSYNARKKYSDIIGLSDGWNSENMGEGALYTVTDPTVPIFRPHIFMAKDADGENIGTATEAFMSRSIATTVQYTINLTGWRDAKGAIWKPNTKVKYQSQKMMVYKKSDFVIKNVAFKKTATEMTTELTLVFPESYNSELKDTYPWN